MTTSKKSSGRAAKPARARSRAPSEGMSVLSRAMHKLPASGPEGFEGLIASMLTRLTGTQFLVRRAGSQQGRDGDADPRAEQAVFFECKRYGQSTELDERDLRTQIDISVDAEPRLDMWVLATTRSVDASAAGWLSAHAQKLGLDFYLLSCGSPSAPGSLDYLSGFFEVEVLRQCRPHVSDIAPVRAYLKEVRKLPDFSSTVERMRQNFSSALVGIPSFRARNNEALLKVIRDETQSRTWLNSPLAPGRFTPVDVPRAAVTAHLNSFLSAALDSSNPRVCVLKGDEGNGKSWALASWVRGLVETPDAPPVFWFKSSGTRQGGLSDLALWATTQLQTGAEEVFRRKLQRWLGRGTQSRAIIVLDGLNERHDASYWTEYIQAMLAETGSGVLLILTCRPETWDGELQPRLFLRASTFTITEFDHREFSESLAGQPREVIDRLWSLGPVARKPRYLADALSYLKEGGDLQAVTVEMLQYQAWKKRYRTRADYPLELTEFEDVLKHLASEMHKRVTAGDLKELLSLNERASEGLRELATAGVLRKERGAMVLERPYLVEGLSLLLVDVLANAAGGLHELRQQIGVFVADTQRHPLTAEICAAAAYKALADEHLRDEAAVAITLEFLGCQNADENSVEGVINLAAKRPMVIAELAEELWALTGSDSTVEHMVLHGLAQLAKEASPGSAIVNVLARWASFVHEYGEFFRSDAGDLTKRTSESVNAVAPALGRVQLGEDGLFVTRVDNQRLVRLGRLALAVSSLAESKQTFFPIILNSLIADAVMLTGRGNISGWILATSRSALDEHVALACGRVNRLTELSEDRRRNIERILLEACAAPNLASRLEELREIRLAEAKKDPFWQLLGRPSREDLASYLVNKSNGLRMRMEAASEYASDLRIKFPPEFASEVEAQAKTFPSTNRRVVLGHTTEDHTWKNLEPLLCRLHPEKYGMLVLDFVSGVAGRAEEAIYPWLFAADGYVSLFEFPQVDAIRQVWERFLDKREPPTDNAKVIEYMTFGMLLGQMTALEQIEQLMRRGKGRPNLLSFEAEFCEVPANTQRQLVLLAGTDEGLLPVLWYGANHKRPEPHIWLALADRALEGRDSVARGFALQLLAKAQPEELSRRLSLVEAVSSDPSHLEQYWRTKLLIDYSTDPAASLLARLDLASCAEVLGSTPSQQRKSLLTSFAGHVLAWMKTQVDPQQTPAAEVPVLVQAPPTQRGGQALVSVDWSQIDNNVSFRSDLSTWGGLERGGDVGELKKGFSDRQFTELQDALKQAMKSAAERGNWAYTASWSDETIRGLLSDVDGFRAEALALVQQAVARRRLRAISSFVSALARVLLSTGDPEGIPLARLLRADDISVRQVDAWTENDLLDVALFSYPKSEEAQELWLERIDACTSDAYLLATCELLVRGGNAGWLLSHARRDLASDAPYLRRRGLMLLAGAGAESNELEDAATKLGAKLVGIEDVLEVGRDYAARLRRMRKWGRDMMEAETALSAKCAAILFLHCADSRVWNVLDELVAQHRVPRSGAAVRQLLPRDDIKKAIKETLKRRDKSLLGYRKMDNDAAPWLKLHAVPKLRLQL